MGSIWGDALITLGTSLPKIGQSIDTYQQNKALREWQRKEMERRARAEEQDIRMQNLRIGEMERNVGEREKAEKNYFDYLNDARMVKDIPSIMAEGPTQKHGQLVRAEEMQGITPTERLQEYGLIGGASYSPMVKTEVGRVLGSEAAKQKTAGQLALSDLGYRQDIEKERLKSQLRSDEERKKEAFKTGLEEKKIAAGLKKAELKGGDKPVQQSKAFELSSTEQGIDMLDNLVAKSSDFALTNTPLDKLRTLNPWDKDVQAFNQLIKTTKQVIGKGLEGGVLRKEDEYKYEQIIPKLGDTKAVRQQKAEQLREMMVNKYNTDLESLGKTGADISRFTPLENKSYSQPQARREVTTSAMPTPQTQEEYDALPSGSIYIDPEDGKRYRKP